MESTLSATAHEPAPSRWAQADDPDHFVVLNGLTWKDFKTLLAMRGDRAGARFYYLEGAVEIMSPSRSHEDIKKTLARLLEAYCDERGIELSGYGAWTLKTSKRKRGAEPDECYIVGDKNKKAPDIVLEVVWTHGGLDKLEIYQGLGIAEVWMWDQKTGLRVFALQGDAYQARAGSGFFPALDLGWLASFLDRPTQSQAVRALRAAMRR